MFGVALIALLALGRAQDVVLEISELSVPGFTGV